MRACQKRKARAQWLDRHTAPHALPQAWTHKGSDFRRNAVHLARRGHWHGGKRAMLHPIIDAGRCRVIGAATLVAAIAFRFDGQALPAVDCTASTCGDGRGRGIGSGGEGRMRPPSTSRHQLVLVRVRGRHVAASMDDNRKRAGAPPALH